MLDGFYQSIMSFYIPYLTVVNTNFVSFNGLNIDDRTRLGAYIAHPVIVTINMYILINTYRWDWAIVACVIISDLLVFVTTAAATANSGQDGFAFYQAAGQIYSQASFWAVFFIVPVVCLFPRFAIKALQKVYFPYDVDIIREQERMGKFAHLTQAPLDNEIPQGRRESTAPSNSSESSRKGKHLHYASVDEDRRPIYPPSVATRTTAQHARSQNGSDGTNYTGHRQSMDLDFVPPVRPSFERARPSYDRFRASMDRVRPSFEASSDFTSAARLSRIESSQSVQHRFHQRLRGLSLSKSANQ
jgi:phospholipid-translocating ATPase